MPDFEIDGKLIEFVSAHSENQWRAQIWRRLDAIQQTQNEIKEIVLQMADTVTDLDAAETAVEGQLATDESDETKFEGDVTAKIAALEAKIAAGNTSPDLTAEVARLQAIQAKLITDDAAANAADAALNPAPAAPAPTN